MPRILKPEDRKIKFSHKAISRWDDPTGNRYGSLIVLGQDIGRNHGQRLWLCMCDCGRKTSRRTVYLTSRKNPACETCVATWAHMGRLTHGAFVNRRDKYGKLSPMPRLYAIWNNMRIRCRNPKDRMWHRYGGRGIRVCDEWQEFINFRDWALSHGYADNLTIDRKDNDGNYEPMNCEWVTQKENSERAWAQHAPEKRREMNRKRFHGAAEKLRQRHYAEADAARMQLGHHLPIEFLWGAS